MRKWLGLTFLLLASPLFAAPLTIQVTIGASATQLSSTVQKCSWFAVQNNAAHTIRIGDSTVTSSRGTVLLAGPGGGSWQPPLTQPATAFDLSQWYVAGTQNDVVDVMCYTVNF
jgi:hypothetical protein